MITLDLMQPTDWEAVKEIYEEGIATGSNTEVYNSDFISVLLCGFVPLWFKKSRTTIWGTSKLNHRDTATGSTQRFTIWLLSLCSSVASCLCGSKKKQRKDLGYK